MIVNINRQAMYGYDGWRLPSDEEYGVMMNTRDFLHLSSDGYKTLTNSDASRIRVRLVSTREETTAQNGQFPTDIYVDRNVVSKMIQNQSEYPSVTVTLESFTKSLQNEADNKTTLFRQKYEEYQKTFSIMPANEKTVQEKELADIQNRYQQFLEECQKRLSAKQSELMAPLWAKIKSAIENVATKGGYRYIFDSTVIRDCGLNTTRLPEISSLIRKELGLE